MRTIGISREQAKSKSILLYKYIKIMFMPTNAFPQMCSWAHFKNLWAGSCAPDFAYMVDAAQRVGKGVQGPHLWQIPKG